MSQSMSDTKKVLIAGGSGGVGQEIARRLAEDGYEVAIGYRRNSSPAQELANSLRSVGYRATAVELDLSSHAAAVDGVTRAIARMGRVDVAVCAAGPYIPQRWLGDIEAPEFDNMMQADTSACFYFLRNVLGSLRESQGSFIALSTPAATRHIKKDALSSIPKAAIEAMVRGVAAEEGRNGVRANCVAVGFIDAGMFHELRRQGDFSDHYVDAAIAAIPLRRMGTGADIANAVAFLADSKSSYITGQTIAVDGGLGG
ncbi:SDR family NAD(P)-dependent oxidoreductase [Rhodococcus erythropolis]